MASVLSRWPVALMCRAEENMVWQGREKCRRWAMSVVGSVRLSGAIWLMVTLTGLIEGILC